METINESDNKSETNPPEPEYQLEAKVLPKIHYAISSNGLPVVLSLIIHNMTLHELKDGEISITGEPGLFRPYKRHIDQIAGETSLLLKSPDVQIDWLSLIAMTESVPGKLTIRLHQGETILAESSFELEILAFDEWPGGLIFPELLASFVTPNHPEIAKLAVSASHLLGQWTSNPSLDGYLSGNPDRVKQQFAAIYGAIQQSNIAYAVPPASFETLGQRVRLCDTIMQQRLGTCLDLALLFASCLESIGLHPLLILAPGHCYAGVWLEEETFPEPVQDDPAMLTKRTAEGIHTISLVECTLATAGKNVDFPHAEKAAAQQLSIPGNFELLVDVRRARVCGIKPLPQKVLTDHGWDIVHEDRDSTTLTHAPDSVLQMKLDPNSTSKTPETKKDFWERRLLDLSLRNALLNLRLTQKCIPMLVARSACLEDAMADGKEFQLFPKPETMGELPNDLILMELKFNTGTVAEQLEMDLNAKRLRTTLSEKELERATLALYRTAKTSLEENGANTLYLAIGFLRWFETDSSERPRYAPILLLPVDLIRKSAQKGYVIRMRDEEPQINITLLEMLRLNYKIEILGLDPLPQDESGVDLVRIFSIIRQAVMNRKRWDIVENAVLGIFSFSQFVMWNDLHNYLPKLAENQIVSSLIQGKLTWQPEIFDDSIDLEQDTLCPLGADSSQLKAVYAAATGRTFVLHGPPGTGKSQTITNIIAFALASGKRVLFVAEKKAALDVVQRRLEKIGLIPYCLELHSNRSNKKDVLDQLDTAIQTPRTQASENWQLEKNRLDELRNTIGRYVEILHCQRNCGYSLYELISRYEGIDESQTLKIPAAWTSQNAETLRTCQDTIDRFYNIVRNMEHPRTHPFRAIRRTQYTQRLRQDVFGQLHEMSLALDVLRNVMNCASDFALYSSIDSFEYWRLSVELLSELLRMKDLPRSWFLQNDPQAFSDRLSTFVENGRNTQRIKETILTVWPQAFLEMDGKELADQFKRYYLDWQKNEAREKLPKSWLNQRDKNEFLRLQQLAKTGLKQETQAAALSCHWSMDFFQQDGESLLAEWQKLWGSVKVIPIQTLPDEWYDQPNHEEFLRSLELACHYGKMADTFSTSLMPNWYKLFLEQDGIGLREKWKKVLATHFFFRYFAMRKFLLELLPWSRQKPTRETAADGIDTLCNYQEQKEWVQRQLNGKESSLKRYQTAEGYLWDRLESDCRFALSHLQELKSFIPLWTARKAFLAKLKSFSTVPEIDPSTLGESLSQLVAFQTADRELRSELDQCPFDLSSFCENHVYDWSRLLSNCDIVLNEWEQYCTYANEWPDRAEFARKFNPVIPEPRTRYIVETGIRNLTEYQRCQHETEVVRETISNEIKIFDNNGKYDYEAIAKANTVFRSGLDSIVTLFLNTGKEKSDVNEIFKRFALIPNMPDWSSVTQDWSRFESARSCLYSELEVDESAIQFDSDYPSGMARTLTNWTNAIEELRTWIQWREMINEMNSLQLDCLIDLWVNGMPTDCMIPVYQKNLYRGLIMRIFDESPELNRFSGDTFEKKIERFRQYESQWTGQVQREIRARISSRIPDFSQDLLNGSEPGILRRAIRSRGRGISIRQLFDRIPNLLARLCPCMLMSPISVAQYLSPDMKPFDLVVFDEASQLTTCKAVGTLARGNTAVIVGDPRQLPPTSFFSTNSTDDDNFEMEDLESILDDCLALALPQTHLRWHYRSRHESLIAFSNNEYYDGGLLTFPSANDNESRVSLIHVPGHYDRGHTRTNHAEAQAIVEDIRYRLKDPVLSRSSMGIVTFSTAQQNLIDDLLSELFKQEPELEIIATTGEEPLFIKNLENVQGDERDIIFFSVGYAPDKNGVLSYNFGPLNRDGGWRRLNVAVTRARSEMVVFSTLKPEEIDTTRTLSKGVAGLKAFLEYSQNGSHVSLLSTKADNTQQNGLANVICRRLNEAGYATRQDIGRSAFRVDIGIVHPDDPSRYLLGVLLDGDHYRSGENVHDRETGRVSVLEGLGWSIHRLWSVDWWDSPDHEIRKILEAIQKAKDDESRLQKKAEDIPANSDSSNTSEPSMPFDFDHPSPDTFAQDKIDSDNEPSRYGSDTPLGSDVEETKAAESDIRMAPDSSDEIAFPLSESFSQNIASEKQPDSTSIPITTPGNTFETYTVCELEPVSFDREHFHNKIHDRTLREQISQILDCEAPVAEEVLYKSVITSWGFGQMGQKIKTRLKKLLKKEGYKTTKHKGTVFVWQNEQDPETYDHFRIPGDQGFRRNLTDIPPQEIGAAAVDIMSRQIGMELDNLILETCKMFGFARGGAEAKKWITEGIYFAVQKGRLVLTGSRIALP